MNDMSRNFSLRDDIINYWSERAQTFDQSFGHRIEPEIEAKAWSALIESAVGPAPRHVLEMACGTGEVTRILLGLGYEVTGIDFAEPMMARARAKHGDNPMARFRLGDAENCMEPDATYDAVLSRHLVWTLLAPQDTFRDWLRVLKPGGALVIFDGQWASPNPFGRFMTPFLTLLDRITGRPAPLSDDMRARHNEIMRQLPFSRGLTFETLRAMLARAGFVDIERLSDRPIIAAQSRIGTFRQAIGTRMHDHVFVRARRPL